jgi:hypothetical protein
MDQGLLPRRYCIISPDALQGFGAGWDEMGLTFPVGPAAMTALAVAVVNILVAWILVRSAGRGIDLSAMTIGILIGVGLICTAGAVFGWRSYLRRRQLS